MMGLENLGLSDLIYMSIIILMLFTFIFMYILAFKWVNFGIYNKIMSGRLKQKMGYLWIRDSGNNFDLPKIIDLNKIKEEIEEDTYHYARGQLLGSTLFGRPFVCFDNEDNKTSLGLYYHQSENSGEPAYLYDKVGKVRRYIRDENGDKIPRLTRIKPAVSLPPSYYKSIVTQETFKNLRKYITDFMTQYKYIFIIVAGIGVGIGVMIYFLYNQQEMLPNVLSACENAVKACTVSK